MKRVFLTHVPDMLANYYGDRALAALREVADVRLNTTGRILDATSLAAEARGAAMVVSDRQTPGEAALFESCRDLVAFLRVAVDIRNIDVAAASRNGVLVTRATPGFVTSVAEMAIGLMIDLTRGISRSAGAYREGREPEARMGRELRGSTLGLVGYGVIAQELARLSRAFGMTILVSDPYRTVADPEIRQLDHDALLASADLVCCLAAATPETENLMGEGSFARMRRGSYFLNLSRGNLVDETALEAALDTGHLAGAAMDVGRAADQKPSLRLAVRGDVIATPHIAGLTLAAIEHQAFDTVAQVRALVRGDIPEGAVNPEAATRLDRLRAPS